MLVQRNWLLGYRIAEEELGGDERSEYGLKVIKDVLVKHFWRLFQVLCKIKKLI